MTRIILALISLSLLLSLMACEHVPEPRIKKAEFPFEIVYELDGETVTVNDIFVCEYDGTLWNENTGRQRQWKGWASRTLRVAWSPH